MEYHRLTDQQSALECTQGLMEENYQTRKKARGKKPAKVPSADALSPEKPTFEVNVKKKDDAALETYKGAERLSMSNEAEPVGFETTQDDLEAIYKKLLTVSEQRHKLATDLKRKSREVADCDQDVADVRLRWDVLQAQVKDLGVQMNGEIIRVYKEVGDLLRKESSLSIDMYYF
eukprot:TRINITY_DN6_c0_g2_i1.p7 TRINITY_DN6_c0_g2~~TRINITY_DN6_c0_g2_i1.p7  ORF type:complete len:175 (+),score=29.69 TRINITY_DN6_c0_g2_i1:2920-3444(+)